MQVSGPPSKLCPKVLKGALTCVSVENFADTTGTPSSTGSPSCRPCGSGHRGAVDLRDRHRIPPELARCRPWLNGETKSSASGLGVCTGSPVRRGERSDVGMW
jgi:hypothetical protein